jgi:Putative peptidoglycan binding domain
MNKSRFIGFLVAAYLVAWSLVAVQTTSAHGMGGGHGGMAMHSFHHGFGHADHHHGFTLRHHGDRFFRHRRFFFGPGFDAFGFPWWYLDSAWYPYDYSYYDDGASYNRQYWTEIAKSVQSELARRGFYHGPINGSIDSSSRKAIQAFQATRKLPVTGMIDPTLLRALKIDFTEE